MVGQVAESVEGGSDLEAIVIRVERLHVEGLVQCKFVLDPFVLMMEDILTTLRENIVNRTLEIVGVESRVACSHKYSLPICISKVVFDFVKDTMPTRV